MHAGESGVMPGSATQGHRGKWTDLSCISFGTGAEWGVAGEDWQKLQQDKFILLYPGNSRGFPLCFPHISQYVSALFANTESNDC